MKLVFLIPFVFLFFLSFSSGDTSQKNNVSDPVSEETKLEETAKNLLLQLKGTQLVDADQNPVYLQGVAFNNFIWNNTPTPPEHHTELDYERVAAMGMNSIRFYMNYRFFEDDTAPYSYKQSGWDWLDQNITWAKKHNIYLVLNMHAPQGGYQSQGKGNALWDTIEKQNRLVALWKEIAKRYKNEVQIAGFGPANEPMPTIAMSQWTILAQRLINEIRKVNKHQLIFIEQAIGVKGKYTKDENFNFPEVTGENLMYEFHGYTPHRYTHQLLSFSKLGDGGKYPDESIIEANNSKWYTTTHKNPSLPKGTTDWTFFEGEPYLINDEKITLAVPALAATKIGGRVYFDDIIVKEFDKNGDFVRDVYKSNLNAIEGWNFYSRDLSGSKGCSTTEGRSDTTSIYIDGTTGESNMAFSEGRFEIIQGYSYQINGWMKGENVANTNAGKIRLDFYKGKIQKRNKAFLENYLGAVVAWAKSKNAPLYMGEFGAGAPCFQNDKGGLVWVADMVDLLKTNNIHFTYHAYHEDAFGLYLGGGLPNENNVNQPLIDWFTTNLKN